MMVTFDICAGNPGALQFLMQAYDMDMFKAEQGFQRMQRAGITGARLYMIEAAVKELDIAVDSTIGTLGGIFVEDNPGKTDGEKELNN